MHGCLMGVSVTAETKQANWGCGWHLPLPGLRLVASWGSSGENGKTEPEYLSGNSEDAMLSGVDVEQHLVFHAEQRWQPLQRQPEQRQR